MEGEAPAPSLSGTNGGSPATEYAIFCLHADARPVAMSAMHALELYTLWFVQVLTLDTDALDGQRFLVGASQVASSLRSRPLALENPYKSELCRVPQMFYALCVSMGCIALMSVAGSRRA